MYASKYTSDEALGDLKSAVEKGDVEVTLIVGPPRTVTTALAGALGQSEAVGVEHVFHEIYSNGRYNPLVEFLHENNGEKPQHIVIKEMAACKHIAALLPLSKHVIFTGREPLQITMAEQYKKTNQARNMHNLSVEDVVDTRLTTQEQLAQFSGNMNPIDIGKTAQWMHDAIAHREAHATPELSVLDGDIFRVMPETVLRQLAAKSGIPYRAQMVDGWDAVHDTADDPWCKTYDKSSGIQRPQQTTPYADGIYDTINYPYSAQFYCSMLASPFTIWPEATPDKSTLEAALDVMAEQCIVKSRGSLLERLSGKTSARMRFDEMEPNTAYSYIASYPAQNAQERDTQVEYLQELRARRPEHKPAFNAIDEKIQAARIPRTTLQLTDEQILNTPQRSRVRG